jgi:hypothetical protein
MLIAAAADRRLRFFFESCQNLLPLQLLVLCLREGAFHRCVLLLDRLTKFMCVCSPSAMENRPFHSILHASQYSNASFQMVFQLNAYARLWPCFRVCLAFHLVHWCSL